MVFLKITAKIKAASINPKNSVSKAEPYILEIVLKNDIL